MDSPDNEEIETLGERRRREAEERTAEILRAKLARVQDEYLLRGEMPAGVMSGEVRLAGRIEN